MEEAYNPETTDKPKKRTIPYSEMVLLGVTLVVGILAWSLLQHIFFVIFNGGGLGVDGGYSVTTLIMTMVAFLLYFSLVSLFLIFSSKIVVYFGNFIFATTPLVLFMGMANPLVLIALSLGLYAVLHSVRYSMHRAHGNQIKFFLPGVLRIGLSLLLFYTIVMISVIHFSVITNEKDASAAIERSLVRYTVTGLNTFMRQFEGYSPQMSLDSFLLLAGTQDLIKGSVNSIDTSALGQFAEIVDIKALTEEVVEREKSIVRNEFVKSLGLSGKEITGDTPITDVWAEYTKVKTVSYIDPYRRFLPLIISVGILLTLLFLSKVFKILIYMLTWLLLHVLKIGKVLTEKEEQITIKRLTL